MQRTFSDEELLAIAKKNSGGGGGGTTNYNQLENKPQIGGVTLQGNKSLADLGIASATDLANKVDKVNGKGLSTNDYTDADKDIVDGVTEALSGKQDELTAGLYIEFDGNEISVKRDITQTEQEISYNFTIPGDYTLRVKKYMQGDLVDTTDYQFNSVVDPINLDSIMEVSKKPGGGFYWVVKNLIASTTQAADYSVELYALQTTTNYTQNFVTTIDADKKLIIQSELDAAIAGKVDKVTGKGLSTNDFTDEYKAAIGSNTSAITAIKDGATLDSFGDVEVALLDKADTSDLGTAAAKDSTNSVTAGSTDLVESGAVKDAIDSAVSRSYHHAGTKTVAQLTHDLLVAANEGNVYNITDSGTTTSDFIEGIGRPIKEGANVGVAKVSDGVYMFDLLSGFVDTSLFVQKSQTSGLIKNDGTVNTTIEDTVAGHTTAIAGKVDKVDGKGLSTNDFTNTYKDKVDNNAGEIEAIVNEYGAKNLFRMLKSPITSDGITITPINGEYITISGTAAQRVDISLCDNSWSLSEINTFIGSYESTANIEIYASIEHTGQSTRYIKLTESGAQFDITDGDRLTRVFVRVYADQSFNGEVIKPMIRDARISDPTYVPYAMTNRELTGSIDQLKSGLTNYFVNLITANAISVANTAKAGTIIAQAQLRHDKRFAELVINLTNENAFDTGDTGVMLNIDWSKTGVSFNGFKSACGTCNTNASYPDFAHAGAISSWTLYETGDVYMRLSESGIKAARLCLVFKLAW